MPFPMSTCFTCRGPSRSLTFNGGAQASPLLIPAALYLVGLPVGQPLLCEPGEALHGLPDQALRLSRVPALVAHPEPYPPLSVGLHQGLDVDPGELRHDLVDDGRQGGLVPEGQRHDTLSVRPVDTAPQHRGHLLLEYPHYLLWH